MGELICVNDAEFTHVVVGRLTSPTSHCKGLCELAIGYTIECTAKAHRRVIRFQVFYQV